MIEESDHALAQRNGPRPSSAPVRLPWIAAGLGIVGLGFGVWFVAGHGASTGGAGQASPPVQTVARLRALAPVSACLLTDSGGVTRAPASVVWAGMQAAGAARKARVSFLALPGKVAAGPVVNSLIAQRCSVIVGVGTGPIAAVESVAVTGAKGVRFAVAGSSGAPGVTGFAAAKAAAATAIGGLLTGGGP